MRFPAPYSPAGSTTRGPSSDSGLRGSISAPKVGGSAGSPALGTPPRGSTGRPTDPSGKGTVGKGDSVPLVRYDHGPTGRGNPKSAGPKGPGWTPSKGKGLSDKDPGTIGKGGSPGKKPGAPGVGSVQGHKGVGSIGGVSAGGFRGGLDLDGGLDPGWVRDPWGCRGWSRWNWGWSSCGWNAWWSFPCYWSWYYPCWWWYSRPYYDTDYYPYQPIATVVYAEPSVVYVQNDNAGYASEPAGEVVASAPVARIAPPASEVSPLSIAAQRYLELGDRAFREGRYTDAVQFYAKAVEFAPDQGALYLVLSDALFAAGDYHYGAYAVRRALELDPALVESQVDKHGFYADPQVFDQQLAVLERYLGEHPSDRDARLVLAMNYLFGGRASEAVRTLVSPAALVGEDPAAQKILARARVLTQ